MRGDRGKERGGLGEKEGVIREDVNLHSHPSDPGAITLHYDSRENKP